MRKVFLSLGDITGRFVRIQATCCSRYVASIFVVPPAVLFCILGRATQTEKHNLSRRWSKVYVEYCFCVDDALDFRFACLPVAWPPASVCAVLSTSKALAMIAYFLDSKRLSAHLAGHLCMCRLNDDKTDLHFWAVFVDLLRRVRQLPHVQIQVVCYRCQKKWRACTAVHLIARNERCFDFCRFCQGWLKRCIAQICFSAHCNFH